MGIQQQWKCKIMLDRTRKQFLKKLWLAKQERLIVLYQSKGRKFSGFVWRLKDLTEETIDQTIETYYKDRKIKHIQALHRWLESRKTLNAKEKRAVGILEKIKAKPVTSTEAMIATIKEEQQQKSAQKPPVAKPTSTAVIRKISTRKTMAATREPAFRYKPTADELSAMIQRAAEEQR